MQSVCIANMIAMLSFSTATAMYIGDEHCNQRLSGQTVLSLTCAVPGMSFPSTYAAVSKSIVQGSVGWGTVGSAPGETFV